MKLTNHSPIDSEDIGICARCGKPSADSIHHPIFPGDYEARKGGVAWPDEPSDELLVAVEEVVPELFASFAEKEQSPSYKAYQAFRAALASAQEPVAAGINCQDCEGHNPVWFAPNSLWNLVMGGPAATDDPGGIVCPGCFIKRAEAAGVIPTGWELRLEDLTPPSDAGLLDVAERALNAFTMKEEWFVSGTLDSFTLRIPIAVIRQAAAALARIRTAKGGA